MFITCKGSISGPMFIWLFFIPTTSRIRSYSLATYFGNTLYIQWVTQSSNSSNSTRSPPSCGILDSRKLIKKFLSYKKPVVLWWIPFHCRILNNELADPMFYKGTNVPPFCSKLPYKRSQTVIHHELKSSNFKN